MFAVVKGHVFNILLTRKQILQIQFQTIEVVICHWQDKITSADFKIFFVIN